MHEFHNLSWITKTNDIFHDILIYWDAPVNYSIIIQFVDLAIKNDLLLAVF